MAATQQQPTKSITFTALRFPAEMWKQVKRLGIDLDKSANQLVVEAVERMLSEHNRAA